MVPLLRAAIRNEIDNVLGKKLGSAKVLDVGAGECPLRDSVAKYSASYFSLDVGQNSSRTIRFCCRIDQALPVDVAEAGPFDFILCTEVMEHVADWSQAFDNFFRLLVPGGYLLITTPFFYMLHEEPNDYWRATDHALKYFAVQNGFQIDHCTRLGNGLDVMGTLLGSSYVCRNEKSAWAFVPTAFIMILHRLLFMMTRWSGVRRYTSLNGNFYLSNVVLLHKPKVSQVGH